jgi:hypothetical protein
MSARFKMTDKGRAAMAAGLDGAPSSAILLMEIMKLTGSLDSENARELFNDLVETFGSVDEAIVAVKSDAVDFTKVAK